MPIYDKIALLYELGIAEKEFSDNITFQIFIKQRILESDHEMLIADAKASNTSFREVIYREISGTAETMLMIENFIDRNGYWNKRGMDLLDVMVKALGSLAQMHGISAGTVKDEMADVKEAISKSIEEGHDISRTQIMIDNFKRQQMQGKRSKNEQWQYESEQHFMNTFEMTEEAYEAAMERRQKRMEA